MGIPVPVSRLPGITRWASVVPKDTRAPDGYPISYLIGYVGSMIPGYCSPRYDMIPAEDCKFLIITHDNDTYREEQTGLLTVHAQLLTTFTPSNIGINDCCGSCCIRFHWWYITAGFRINSAKYNIHIHVFVYKTLTKRNEITRKSRN